MGVRAVLMAMDPLMRLPATQDSVLFGRYTSNIDAGTGIGFSWLAHAFDTKNPGKPGFSLPRDGQAF